MASAVVFGHVLDGLVWHRLRAAGVLPETALSVERPYWNGCFWHSFASKRPDAIGIRDLTRRTSADTCVSADVDTGE